jgi:hypothetical protein
LYDIGSFFKLVELLMDRAILYGINAYEEHQANKLQRALG